MKTKQPLKKLSKLLLLSLIVLSVLTACMNSSETETESLPIRPSNLTEEVSASGEVRPIRWVTLSYPSGATDLDVKVTVGEEVSKGTTLVSSNDTKFLTAFYQSQAALERAQLVYNQVTFPPSQAAIASAEAALANAEANLDINDHDEARRTVVEAAEADLEAAQANLDDLLAGASIEEKNAADKDLKAAELALDQAREAFDLVAPYSGRVIEVYVNSGEAIGAGQPVLILADLSELRVFTTDLSEVDVARLSEGQSAEVVFDALSEQTFSGTIDRIADQASGTSSVYYEVTIELDEVPEELRWGMTAFITFPVE